MELERPAKNPPPETGFQTDGTDTLSREMNRCESILPPVE
jgi:hypothetical protein